VSWKFWIDRGGTFTDCIAISPQGAVFIQKILSSDSAPVEAIRAVLREADAGDPAALSMDVRLGTTVATNALLERRGVPTALVTNQGLADVFVIGTQARPELFDLEIRRPPPLHSATCEVAGRIAADGSVLEALDLEAARGELRRARAAGARAVAVACLHAYADPQQEAALAALARDEGFEYVVASHELAAEQGLLARGETAAADAYLTPLLRAHGNALSEALPSARLRFMQSSGGLTRAERFRGPGALLSGPAGGVIATARVARAAGFERAVGFDMGGTSTDVSLVVDGEVPRSFESEVGGIRVKAPMLRVHTVAAGGGSLCRFDGVALQVGPESAGSRPGPLCYGLRDAAGERLATELALTDANFALGRVAGDRFPFPLERPPVDAALDRQVAALRSAGFVRSREEVAAGFVEIANHHMAQAIAKVSVARGVDVREGALVGFGGAAGQHVCAVARILGVKQVLLHPWAGLLSAYGIGVAESIWDGQREAGRISLPADGEALPTRIERAFAELADEGREVLRREQAAAPPQIERWLELRYAGTDTSLAIRAAGPGEPGPQSEGFAWRRAFEAEHRTRFGYVRPEREIEIVTARVRARTGEAGDPGAEAAALVAAVPRKGAGSVRQAALWLPGQGTTKVPVHDRESLRPGRELVGPALVLEDIGTIVIDPGFRARVEADGLMRLVDQGAEAVRSGDASDIDPVRLEVFGSRFMAIAEQMGAVLRNTSVSANIKERLDYSCAVFDAQGSLVANAPHIPVHLGAMGETVRAVRSRFPKLEPGDVVATNDPFEGGSHLPDVTVVSPVFLPGARAPAFFVASRGHHADIGGRTPGSMPPDSHTLEEEGVLLEPFRIVRGGHFDEAGLLARLSGARYPARNPEDNRADLEAMIAANRAGHELLERFVAEEGEARVRLTTGQLQQAAAAKVRREIARLPDGAYRFDDRMDDGTPVCVEITVRGDGMCIDFAGTGPAVPGNLNAPPAVVRAAVLYVVRALVAERFPLNGGCLEPVELRVPAGSLIDPPRGCAVVGGNVETSQRVVDVLLGALGLAAASQGTMNNVTFGDADFGYYETLGGGAGAGPDFPGASAVHTHMTNTLITDPEVLEARYPVRLRRFALRPHSGGAGRWAGGDGLVRVYEFLAPVTVSLLTERRSVPPFGLAGGEPGRVGVDRVRRADGRVEPLAGKCSLVCAPGDRLEVETPGGGGFGTP